MSRKQKRNRRGQALVEFALIALVMYLLIAAVLDFGRATYVAQGLQSAADLLARELSRTPLPADVTLDDLHLNDPTNVNPLVKTTVFDPALLNNVIPTDQDLWDAVTGWPVVNQQLASLMIVTRDANGNQVFQYPGVFQDADGLFKFNVLKSDGSIDKVPVIEEIQPGAFSVGSSTHGMAGIRINYPFHAAAMSSFNNNTRVMSPEPLQPGDVGGPYSGPSGLGQQATGWGTVVPFSKTISAQAVYRREVFQ